MDALVLPRLVFGPGRIAALPNELALLSIERPLLVSDIGVARAGVASATIDAMQWAATFLDVLENPTALAADQALALYRERGCDGIVALGGGSVLDTAKIVAAVAASGFDRSDAIIGNPQLIRAAAPLVAIPTTLGTGSESSPVASLHPRSNATAVGTRSHHLVPRLALCDPDLSRTLPGRLLAATAIDALSHCLEGYFAEPGHALIDAIALDGIRRVFADVLAALAPDGDAARASLMSAAYAGGVAIHKGLGSAHAIALTLGHQHLHHGTVIGIALPHTTRLLARHVPDKAAQVAQAMGLATADELGGALARLTDSLNLPKTLTGVTIKADELEETVDQIAASHFNLTSAYVPTRAEYRNILFHMGLQAGPPCLTIPAAGDRQT